jgi:DNA modification methylase
MTIARNQAYKNRHQTWSEKLKRTNSDVEIYAILNDLGKLPKETDGAVFVPLLFHPNHRIRYMAIKNLGKLADTKFLPALLDALQTEENSANKREVVSGIGRMRSRDTIPYLFDLLKDANPEIVLQAVRALLVFKKDNHIAKRLRELSQHPNEIIRDYIDAELNLPPATQAQKRNQVVSPATLKNVVVEGDVRHILPSVPDESIHLTFTSPPYYNARDYSIYTSYQSYLEFLQDVFQQTHRITKEGRFLIVNTSPVIVPRVSRKHASRRYPIPFDLHTILQQQGWQFVDDIVWVKPEASVKNRNGGFLQHRKPLAYKPNAITEYLMVYRKKTHHLLDWNMRAYAEETIEQSKIEGDYESSNAWHIDPKADKIHSAIFPVELCRRVIQYYSYKGDLVFDPFAGSGTLGFTAMQHERHFFMTEQNETYVERIQDRLGGGTLFGEIQPKLYTLNQFREVMQNDTQ